MHKTLRVEPDGEALAQAALEFVRERLDRSEGPFWLALAGGSTPRALYRRMAQAPLPWERLNLVWSDERFVSPEHPDSNFRMVKEALLDSGHLPASQVHPWPILTDAALSAEAFEATLRQLTPSGVQLALLGMGEDGHTASLFPGTRALSEQQRWATANWVEKLECWRLTLTYPYLAMAQEALCLLSGKSKNAALRDVLQGNLPAGAITANQGVFFLADSAAAQGIPSGRH